MSRRIFFALSVALLMLPTLICAQNHGGSPVLQPGQGLETTRKDLAETHNNKQEKRTEQVDVYMFAVSYSLIDSTMYISDVQFMPDETLNNHWFLKNRQGYENQFSAYVTDGNDESQLAFLYFSEKKEKVTRKIERIMKRNAKTNNFPITRVGSGNFTFSKVE